MSQTFRILFVSVVLLSFTRLLGIDALSRAQDQPTQVQSGHQDTPAPMAGGSSAAHGEPKSQSTASRVLVFDTRPNSSTLARLKMHWNCLKSGGKWKRVSDTASQGADNKGYSETRTWACQEKAK